eukprot:CAMPEP_0174725562 /NCGR_PEP_ID=MMETSP1094-20130205/45919_1 /TAXON_ID=156173 /ORGANISM="Chrysochromulina brevifilum, Strain UTEX LB 985" /LENGTH=63 /DNA_ID=CAMNT_0015926995 /DNA_START=35 /DNA_END=226 /DNA_ORIENTATION=+
MSATTFSDKDKAQILRQMLGLEFSLSMDDTIAAAAAKMGKSPSGSSSQRLNSLFFDMSIEFDP